MRKYDFDKVVDKTQLYSAKWSIGQELIKMGYTEKYDESTISVFTAGMDFECPDAMKEACHKVVDHNIYGHCWLAEDNCDCFSALINWLRTKYDWEFKYEEMTYVSSTIDITKFALECLTQPGDQVVLNKPIYSPFMGAIRKTGRVLVNSELVNDGEGYYTIDLEDMEKKLSDDETTYLVLCNPHNPTGRVRSDGKPKKLANICRRDNVMIIADETHGDLCRMETSLRPIAEVRGPQDIVTMASQNKTFDMAGLGVCNMVIQDEELNKKCQDYVGFIMPNPFTIAAPIVAYKEGDEWLQQLREYLDRTIGWTVNFLKENMPKMEAARPEGTYFLWMDFREYGLPSKETHDKIYLDANVIMEDGEGFNTEYGCGFQRVCLFTRRSMIQEAFTRTAKASENY